MEVFLAESDTKKYAGVWRYEYLLGQRNFAFGIRMKSFRIAREFGFQ
jgi:hypothetical protein